MINVVALATRRVRGALFCDGSAMMADLGNFRVGAFLLWHLAEEQARVNPSLLQPKTLVACQALSTAW
jgi:hypothetical protein